MLFGDNDVPTAFYNNIPGIQAQPTRSTILCRAKVFADIIPIQFSVSKTIPRREAGDGVLDLGITFYRRRKILQKLL